MLGLFSCAGVTGSVGVLCHVRITQMAGLIESHVHHTFSCRGELHILLQHSKSLSEFHSIVKDIEGTLTDVLDSEEDMADMYLTHAANTG